MKGAAKKRDLWHEPEDVLRTNGVEILNAEGSASVLLACDHAGNIIPPHFNDLGVSDEALRRHVAFDIGAADVTRALSQALDAPAIFQHVSRLVIDVNRGLSHPESIPEQSDDVVVPGNKALSLAQRRERELFFWDYHINLGALIARLRAAGRDPVIFFVHSFTEMLRLQGVERPWHLGILHGEDRALSDLLQDELRQTFPDLLIGDDEPYSGGTSGAFSHAAHAEAAGLPFVLLEIRQDLIATPEGAALWAERLKPPFLRALARLEPRRPGKARPEAPANLGAQIAGQRLGKPHPFAMGIEEEYVIVDRDTGAVVSDPSWDALEALKSVQPGRTSPGALRVQIDAGTGLKDTVKALREEVTGLRARVRDALREYGLELLAAGSHPAAPADEPLVTSLARHQSVPRDQAHPDGRPLTCGMNILAGIPDPEMRNDLFGQIRPFLPIFLALSTSSPFWHGRRTDVMCNRLPVLHELKNGCLPPVFGSFQAYVDYVDEAVRMKVLEDPAMLWWDVRPSWTDPALEVRVCDACTSVEDGVAIAALCLCTLSMLARLRETGRGYRLYDEDLIEANLAEAGRHGTGCRMVDVLREGRVAFGEMLDGLIAMIGPDIEAYDCAAEIGHVREIVARGTSADRQLRIYDAALGRGATPDEATGQVLRWLMDETVRI